MTVEGKRGNDATTDQHARRGADHDDCNYDRLAQIKNRYDLGNIFHTNQNIQPAGARS